MVSLLQGQFNLDLEVFKNNWRNIRNVHCGKIRLRMKGSFGLIEIRRRLGPLWNASLENFSSFCKELCIDMRWIIVCECGTTNQIRNISSESDFYWHKIIFYSEQFILLSHKIPVATFLYSIHINSLYYKPLLSLEEFHIFCLSILSKEWIHFIILKSRPVALPVL